jgi:hypothetical protein|tara:strand:+ start:160 stop:366 length:207 start_codon:yes stop_codon:yes gene_type:complete
MKRKTKKMERGMIEFGADCITITIESEPWKVGRIHSVNKAGAGKHKDRRTKRNRTRANQNKTAIRESM